MLCLALLERGRNSCGHPSNLVLACVKSGADSIAAELGTGPV